MKIAFFGTPEIASFCLDYLSARHDVVAVITGEDKPRGRKKRVSPTPVKEVALRENIPLLQPSTLKDDAVVQQLRGLDADVFVVVAYGKIVPRAIFDAPHHGTINLHPSLLPKYRGAAPIQWSLINGEEETGITVQRINEELDAGDILLQESISLTETMSAADLYDIVLPRGADMLDRVLQGLATGTVSPVPQNHDEASYCGKIDRETSRIDWNSSARQIHNLVRGLNPQPGAWTTLNDEIVKIWRTLPLDDHEGRPGEITIAGKHILHVGTGMGTLQIEMLQPQSRKSMDATAFINGLRGDETMVFV